LIGDKELSTRETLKSFTLHSPLPIVLPDENDDGEERRDDDFEMFLLKSFNLRDGLIRTPTSLTIDTIGVSDPNIRI